MSPAFRTPILVLAVALLVGATVLATNHQTILVETPSAATSPSTIERAILTAGDAIVSKRPDLATVSAGVASEQPTAAAAQSDLAGKAAKLIARIKGLGVSDGDLSTTGYWVGPVYSPDGRTVSSYRAAEQLQIKWHDVDTVGRALDAIGQEGGATNVGVSFGLADPKPAQAQARTLAIADARAKAEAMASAAGVRLGQVLRVSDLASGTRPPAPLAFAGAAAVPTQVPVGELDVQVSVEVDFAIA